MSRYRPLRAAALVLSVALLSSLLWLSPAYAAPATAWGWPLQPPQVTRYFDPPDAPWGPGHRGVDLAGTPGQQVLAAGAGTVAYAGMVAGRPVISINHPSGLRTTYEPVHSDLSAGTPVALGQVIGTLEAGHAGCPTSACLHWGLRRGTVYLDPLQLIGGIQVRLLPLDGVPPGVLPAEVSSVITAT